MFVAWRDLRFAKGRFALIAVVVALITLLVGFLSGLTAGLAAQNVSAIVRIPADRIVLAEPAQGDRGEGPGGTSFANSVLPSDAARGWRSSAGVGNVVAYGVAQTRMTVGDRRTAVSMLAASSGADAMRSGTVTVPADVASDLGVTRGDVVTIAGHDLRVGAIEDTGWYSHTPVVRIALTDWRSIAAATGSGAADGRGTPTASFLAVSSSGAVDWDVVAARTGTVAANPLLALMAIGSFRSEIGSLLMMVAMLFGISALVIGAFFTVWSLQRRGDVAVLAALGATTRTLVVDALGQALVVLVVGVGVGIGATAALGALVGQALPFVLSPWTTVLPGVLLVVLGAVGATFALRSVVRADPLTALGSNR